MHRDANKIIPISFIMDDVVVSDVPIRKKKPLDGLVDVARDDNSDDKDGMMIMITTIKPIIKKY